MNEDPRNNLDLVWRELKSVHPVYGNKLAERLGAPYWKTHGALCHLRAQGRAENIHKSGWRAL